MTIPAGTTETTHDEPLIEDLLDEANETYTLVVTGTAGGAVGDTTDTGLGTITDNDGAPNVTINDVTVDEGAGTATFTVTLSNPSASDIDITVATSDGTAVAPGDYTSTTTTVTIPAGSTTATVDVPMIEDLLDEADETYTVAVTGTAGGAVGDTTDTGLGTITDNDNTPAATIDDVILNEGDSGSTPFIFTVTLTNPSATDVSADYTAVGGTASAGSDFVAAAGTLTIAAGSLSGQITVNVIGDVAGEPDENFTIGLSNPSGLTISDPQGAATIVNDDFGTDGTVSITPTSFPGETLTVTVDDPDLNVSPTLPDTVIVDVVNDMTGEVEQVTLTETGPNTNIFLGTIPTILGTVAGTNNDAVLNTQGSDTVTANYNDSFTSTGGTAARTDTGVVEDLAAIQGFAWIDENGNNLFDATENPVDGWTIDIEKSGSILVTTTTASDGSYSAPNLIPDTGYAVVLRHPETDVEWDRLANVTLPSGVTLVDQNLPIDPSGIVYDAETRTPLTAAELTLVNQSGTPVAASCLASGQQGQATGSDGAYRFDVQVGADPSCPSDGVYTIVLDSPALYLSRISALIPPLPGPFDPTGLTDPVLIVSNFAIPQAGDSTDYYLDFQLAAGDPNIVNNHIPVDPQVLDQFSLRTFKTADRRQAVIGELIRYTVTVENNTSPAVDVVDMSVVDTLPAGFSFVNGSARLNGEETGFTVSGTRPIRFNGISLPAGEALTLSYVLRVGSGVVQGNYVNRVAPFLDGIRVGNEATATVEIGSDPDFQQTTIIGKVFNDANGDGWQDPGEDGIPGVRIASVSGLLVETDAYGRYHMAGLEGGRFDRGRNFILKVDPSTLPEGTVFTTENPRVKRITEGLMNRFDFGVRLPQQETCCKAIEVKLGEIFFLPGADKIRPEYMPLMKELAQRLRESGGGTLFIQGHADTLPSRPSESKIKMVETVKETKLTLTRPFGNRKASLTASQKRELEQVAAPWQGLKDIRIEVTGHTSSTPIAPANRDEFADNYVLSQARARSVADYLRARLNLSDDQIVTVGKGPDEPLATNDTAEGRARNRRIDLRISGISLSAADTIVPGPDAEAERPDLAHRRARAVEKILRRLLGDELMQKIKIQPGAEGERTDAPQQPPAGEKMSGGLQKNEEQLGVMRFARRAVGTLVDLLIPSASAAEGPAEPCTVDLCRTEDGYVVEIISRDETPATAGLPASNARDREADRRVDVGGRFTVNLPGGGRLWATEDPGVIDPRLAVAGPTALPVSRGKIEGPALFSAYTNYATFMTRLEVVIYRARDEDHIKPIATIEGNLGSLVRFQWDGTTAVGQNFRPGDQLVYLLRAYDQEGHVDETASKKIDLVDSRAFADFRGPQEPPFPPVHGERRATGEEALRDATPLAGNVVTFKPPIPEVATVTRFKVYTVTPHFAVRKAELREADRAELDRIADDWRGVRNVRVQAIGHTDSVRIAPENRLEFRNNHVLSEARAASVARYLSQVLGLSEEQVVIEGKGPDEPMASNDTAAGRALNRRVELTIWGEAEIRRQKARPLDLKLEDRESGREVSAAAGLLDAEEALRHARGEVEEEGGEAGGAWTADHRVKLQGGTLASVYGRNDLRRQSIPIYGSRVRVHGQDLGGDYGLVINGEAIPVDTTGKFAVEYMRPVGSHEFAVDLMTSKGEVECSRELAVDVTGKHLFLVALADLTVSGNHISGSVEPLAVDDRYDDDVTVDGRFAFYLKGKIKGKYLITGQMDSQEEELKDVFRYLHRKDPDSLFRRLDPDRYYPVYGDDSTTIQDVDTQGRLYLRVDWDKSQVLWGNYHTGITGNEFAQYNRSLYGAKVHHESLKTNAFDDARTDANVFVSDAQTVLGHAEFLGTGGSLYYLKQTDIVPGSDKVRIEVRDRDSNRVIQNTTLAQGTDYEIDEIQGRIILTRPLLQVARQAAPSLVKDVPLDGNDVVLLVDYEYVPTSFDPDDITIGGRIKRWVTPYLSLATTYVDENRGGEDYRLAGADVTLQTGRGTYVKAEYAESESSQTDNWFSDDGGLTFEKRNLTTNSEIDGKAVGVEARVNFAEVTDGRREGAAAAWWKDRDEGFSSARVGDGQETREYGGEVSWTVNEKLSLASRGTVLELDENRKESAFGVQADYRAGEKTTVGAEVRYVNDEPDVGDEEKATLAALKVGYAVTPRVNVYGVAQTALDQSDAYEDNDLYTLGLKTEWSKRLSLQAEASTGDRGDSALLGSSYRLNDRHELYGTYTLSTDRRDDQFSNIFTLGERVGLSDQLRVYHENQFSHSDRQSGIAHVFGLDFEASRYLNLGASFQSSSLDDDNDGIERDSGTLSALYRRDQTRLSSKLEYRRDGGSEDRRQWLTTNALNYKWNPDYTWLGKLSLSRTEDDLDDEGDARFIEASLGLAYRPVAHDRLNLLGKYTYLYDLPSLAQDGIATDQRSHILSLEGLYRLNRLWELGSKVAFRNGELRSDRNHGDWFKSSTRFAAVRGNYHVIRNWDALLEYRWLDVDEAGTTRQGFLVGISRHLGDHFKLGVGYNFTDFSDDLTELDYDYKGWFINTIGKY
ncbi:MAG: OmpA family protein [bacterium]|nr:OmpA family protein [bacterium]